jgi:hypothetical protein
LPSSVKVHVAGLFVDGEVLIVQHRDDLVDGLVKSVRSSDCPEMISGVRASSIRMESTSSTMAKWCSALPAAIWTSR